MYQSFIRPLLFKLDAEKAHHFSARLLRSQILSPFFPRTILPAEFPEEMFKTQLCGIPLKHPIGLAAGFDKDAKLLPNLHRLGFSYIEVGTVTAHPQSGNPKPRLFRLPKDQALINRMGFNNDGAEAAASRLKNLKLLHPIGGNIGKSKITPLEKACEDYVFSLKALSPFVDYFVVNVSSPNTPNLRNLQEKKPLAELLFALCQENLSKKPMLLKIAPDLTNDALEDVIEVVIACGIRGVIATNTTISRDGLKTPLRDIERIGGGGLSGAPLKRRALEVVRFLRKGLPEDIRIVGVGGLYTGEDVLQAVMAGTDCVQIYTGLVYRGPKTVALMLKELGIALKKRGFNSLAEAVGSHP